MGSYVQEGGCVDGEGGVEDDAAFIGVGGGVLWGGWVVWVEGVSVCIVFSRCLLLRGTMSSKHCCPLPRLVWFCIVAKQGVWDKVGDCWAGFLKADTERGCGEPKSMPCPQALPKHIKTL